MNSKTSADRVLRHRLRKAGILSPLPICSCCGNTYNKQRPENLCYACWLRTPAGRNYRNAERQRQRQQQP